jgi:hypothetical protein
VGESVGGTPVGSEVGSAFVGDIVVGGAVVGDAVVGGSETLSTLNCFSSEFPNSAPDATSEPLTLTE